jgi:predicted metal-dependent hydrolase
MSSVQIGKTNIPYTVRESLKTKRMTIHLTPDTMEVVVPQETSYDSVEAFVERKRAWVYQKREELLERAARIIGGRPMRHVSGAKIAFRGRLMPLEVVETSEKSIRVEYKGKFIVHVPLEIAADEREDAVRTALDHWIRERVEQDCTVLVRSYCKKLDLEAKGLRVKEQKHLWGSCGKDRIININWKLGRAPKKVLEYVVAHEVCHLKYRNHSDEFWQLLRSVFNEVDECKRWLEVNGGEGIDV